MPDKIISHTFKIGRNEELHIFFNTETRLLVVDVIKGDFGNEFVRRTAPKINLAEYRRAFRNMPEANDA